MRSTLFLAFLTFASAEVFAGHNDHRCHHSCASKSKVAATVKLNTPATGSAPTKDFKASTSLPVAKLAAAAKQAKKASMKYQISQGSKTWSTIFTNWANFKSMSTRLLITYKISLMSTHSLVQGSAYMWTADMDIDCNGIDFWHKVGTPLTAIIPSSNLDPWDYNRDSQAQTNLGALAAYEVPWIVIPGSFISKHSKDLPGNNVAAVICNGNMFYGIFGDSNGDSPEVIGEASWRMATACFPNGKISGANGHATADVTYIAFSGKNAVLPSTSMTKNYIMQFTMLRSMGDQLVSDLSSHLGLSSGSVLASTNDTTTTTTKPKPKSCSR